MKKTIRLIVAAVLAGLLAGPQFTPAMAWNVGNYTDLLPNPTSASSVPSANISYNGYNWQLVPTIYSATTTVNVTNTVTQTTFTAISGQGSIGSTTYPATWVNAGRIIRITARGMYTTTTGQQSWTWGLNIGTTTVITSSSSVVISVASQPFTLSGIISIASTGVAGAVNAGYDIFATTAPLSTSNPNISNVVSYSTVTAAAQTVDLTSQLTVNPWFKWGQATQGNNIQFNSVIVEYVN